MIKIVVYYTVYYIHNSGKLAYFGNHRSYEPKGPKLKLASFVGYPAESINISFAYDLYLRHVA